MISDSSAFRDATETVTVIEKLLVDNDMGGVDYNSYNRNVNAFPYVQLLASLNNRINKLEKKRSK